MALTATNHNLLAPADVQGVVAVGDYLVGITNRDKTSGGPYAFNGSGYFSVLHMPTMTERGFIGLDGRLKYAACCGAHSGGRVFVSPNGSGLVGTPDLCIITPSTGAVQKADLGNGDATAAVSVGDWVWRLAGSTFPRGMNPDTMSAVDAASATPRDAIGSIDGRLFLAEGSPFTVQEYNPSTGAAIGSAHVSGIGGSVAGRGVNRGGRIYWRSSAGFVSFNPTTNEMAEHPLTPATGAPTRSDPFEVDANGNICWIRSGLFCVANPDTGRWLTESLAGFNGSRGVGLALYGGKIWSAAGEPFS